MGCDGGTIPKRDELVKTKKRPEKNAKDIENVAKWSYCHLSQELLQQPVVADLLGYLYNKDTLIQYLLERSKYESGPAYVKKLKDVVELRLKSNPGYALNQIEIGNEFIDTNKSRWICPITGLEMNGVYKFYCIFSCGCVISERALKSVLQTSSTSLKCLNCEKVYTNNDLVILNPNEDDLLINQDKFNTRKSNKTNSNKTENGDNLKVESKTSEPSKSAENKDVESNKSVESKLSASTSSLTSKSSIATAASVSSSTTQKRSHAQSEIKSETKPKAAAAAADNNSKNDAKKAKTIQDDPKASAVYKSLFTTSDKAKNQQKAHWVTFNPQYF